ncbi:hypothetical protein BH11PLA2_BH11PLA2_04000 [soil metagenome]
MPAADASDAGETVAVLVNLLCVLGFPMYSMVMMMAIAGSGDVSSFGGHKGGCSGAAASCCGTVAATSSCSGSSCHGRVGLFAKHKANKASCCGTVAAPVCCAPVAVVAPAPVYVAPTPVCAPAPVCCPAPVSTGCCGGRVGFFAKHRAKKEAKHSSCCGAVAAPTCCGSTVSVASPCAPTMVAPPAAAPQTMPKPDAAPMKKSS